MKKYKYYLIYNDHVEGPMTKGAAERTSNAVNAFVTVYPQVYMIRGDVYIKKRRKTRYRYKKHQFKKGDLYFSDIAEEMRIPLWLAVQIYKGMRNK